MPIYTGQFSNTVPHPENLFAVEKYPISDTLKKCVISQINGFSSFERNFKYFAIAAIRRTTYEYLTCAIVQTMYEFVHHYAIKYG